MSEENRNDTSISVADNNDSVSEAEQVGLSEMVDAALADIHTKIERGNAITVPIVQLGLLGGTVASMIPAFRTVTGMATVSSGDLYRVINLGKNQLKPMNNGNYWAAFNDAERNGKSGGHRPHDQI